MAKCLHTTTTLLNDKCPTPSTGDPFRIQKLAKYWSYFLNNSPPTFGIQDWFHGQSFSAIGSASPSMMFVGKLVKQKPALWRELLHREQRIGGPTNPVITCDIPEIPVVLKCYYVSRERCSPPALKGETRAHARNVQNSREGAQQALIYEKGVYSCIISNLDEVPFFVYPIATVEQECTADEINLFMTGRQLPSTTQTLMSNVYRMNGGCILPGKFHITVSEDCGKLKLSEYIDRPWGYLMWQHKLGGKEGFEMESSLKKWVLQEGLPTSKIRPDLFYQLKQKYMRKYFVAVLQLLTGLESMQRHKICHNDLHFANILVKQNERFFFNYLDQKVVTVVSDGDPVIEMTDMIKIFDWDRATSKDQGRNTFLEHIEFYTEAYNPSADMLGVLKTLYYTDKSKFGKLAEVTMAGSVDTIAKLPAWAREKYDPDRAWLTCKPGGARHGGCDDAWTEDVHKLVRKWGTEVYRNAVNIIIGIDKEIKHKLWLTHLDV